LGNAATAAHMAANTSADDQHRFHDFDFGDPASGTFALQFAKLFAVETVGCFRNNGVALGIKAGGKIGTGDINNGHFSCSK
jgi:hypothetical protein